VLEDVVLVNRDVLVDRRGGREHRLHGAVLVPRRVGRALAVGVVGEGVARHRDVLGVPPLVAVAVDLCVERRRAAAGGGAAVLAPAAARGVLVEDDAVGVV